MADMLGCTYRMLALGTCKDWADPGSVQVAAQAAVQAVPGSSESLMTLAALWDTLQVGEGLPQVQPGAANWFAQRPAA